MADSPLQMMPEAETSLRLALHLLQTGLAGSVLVAIDGAQVRTLEKVHFEIGSFLIASHCEGIAPMTEWRGTYRHNPSSGRITVHSASGQGDVVAKLRDGRTFRAECKKGTLSPSKSSSEYPLLREALGQLLTMEEVGPSDILAVAVPHSIRFAALAARWRRAPLMRRVELQILTVSREDGVHGLEVGAPAA